MISEQEGFYAERRQHGKENARQCSDKIGLSKTLVFELFEPGNALGGDYEGDRLVLTEIRKEGDDKPLKYSYSRPSTIGLLGFACVAGVFRKDLNTPSPF